MQSQSVKCGRACYVEAVVLAAGAGVVGSKVCLAAGAGEVLSKLETEAWGQIVNTLCPFQCCKYKVL